MVKEKLFNDIHNIMETLRGENGCPWDRAQNLRTLRGNIIEEAYELVDAINGGDIEDIKEEAGDLLLQTVFISQLLKEEKKGDIYDVLSLLKKKLINRHPHVFGDRKAKTPEEAIESWNSVKNQGKSGFDFEKYGKFPALTEAYKIGRKGEKIGLDWKNPEDVFDKIDEEIDELKKAIRNLKKEEIEEELGDLLFTIVNLSRKLGIEPEVALKKGNKKFIQRVKNILEKKKDGENKDIEILWEETKQKL